MSDLVVPAGWKREDGHDRPHPVLVPDGRNGVFTASSWPVPTDVELRDGYTSEVTLDLDRASEHRVIVRPSGRTNRVTIRLPVDGGQPQPAAIDGGSDRTQPLEITVKRGGADRPVEIELRDAFVKVVRSDPPVHLRVAAPSKMIPGGVTAIHADADTTLLEGISEVGHVTVSGGVSLTTYNTASLQHLSLVEPAGRVTVDCDAKGQRFVEVHRLSAADDAVLVAGERVRVRLIAADPAVRLDCERAGYFELTNTTLDGAQFADNARIEGRKAYITAASGAVTVGEFIDSVLQCDEGDSLYIRDIHVQSGPGKAEVSVARSEFIGVRLPTDSAAVHMLDKLDAAHRFSPSIKVESWDKITSRDLDEARREATLLARMITLAEAKHGEPAALAGLKFQRYQLRRYASPDAAERRALHVLRWFGYGQRWQEPVGVWLLLALVGTMVHEISLRGWQVTRTPEAFGQWLAAFVGTLFAPVGLLRPIDGWFPSGGPGIINGVILALASVAFGSVLVALRRLTRYE